MKMENICLQLKLCLTTLYYTILYNINSQIVYDKRFTQYLLQSSNITVRLTIFSNLLV